MRLNSSAVISPAWRRRNAWISHSGRVHDPTVVTGKSFACAIYHASQAKNVRLLLQRSRAMASASHYSVVGAFGD
jgi:hypothetical protein